nr:HlyD family efflux transporter periplasmic adaptor subunit [Oscillochloris trichoides]
MKKLLLLLTLALLASGCTNMSTSATPTPSVPNGATSVPVVGGTLRAEAKVVPLRSASLSMPVGGVVAEVLVSEGATVQADQPLIRIERSRLEAALAQAQAEVQVAQASYDRLLAGATPEQIAAAEAQLAQARAGLRQVSGGVTPSDIAAAQAQLAQAQAALAQLQQGPEDADLRQAQAQLAQAQANAQNQRDSFVAAKLRAESQLEQAANALRTAQDTYSRIYWENQEIGADDLTQAQKDAETAALRAVEDAEQALAQAQIALQNAQDAERSGTEVAEAQVRDAQARLDKLLTPAAADKLAAARAQVSQAEANLNRLRGEQRAGSLAAARAQIDQAEANLAGLRAGTSEGDLNVAAAQIQRAEAALNLAQVALAETELRAPFAGTIASITPAPGEYVSMGTPLITLADLSAWQIETTDLTEQDIARVHEGDQVLITLDALPDLELQGVVSHIRLVGENKQGDITYTVTITPETQDSRLRWNMTASVRFVE